MQSFTLEICTFIILAGLLSLAMTGLIRRYALASRLMDIPNERSSHSVPTPRGGGIAIVLTYLVSLPLLAWGEWLNINVLIGIWGAGLLVALVGFLDDHGHIAARWRLLAHFCAAGWGLFWLGGLPAISLFGYSMNLSWLGNLLAAVYLVWLLNLYNFMDGIDGIASIEAITVCFGGVLLYWVVTPADPAWVSVILLLVCVTGFFYWNFPPAKIFMGDAGSGFLGLMLGLLSIQAAWIHSDLIWGWLILLGAFIVDATVTLVRRVLRGEKFYEAHRSHAYQYASRKYRAHKPVSLVFGIINLGWLLPLALLAVGGWLDGLVALLIAYAPLVMAAFYYKAGNGLQQEV